MEGHTHDPIASAKAQEATHRFEFRDATTADIPALQTMIGESLRALGKGYYTQAELDGSIGYLFGPDTLLLHYGSEKMNVAKLAGQGELILGTQDRTYFILHPLGSPDVISACGGWSFRRTLYGADTAPNRFPEARDPKVERASIRAIFTHPDWARRGLGTMMMRHCESKAREGGFSGLEMGATLSGVALYERCGYTRSGKMDVVRCPNGEGIQIVHMLKDAPELSGETRESGIEEK